MCGGTRRWGAGIFIHESKDSVSVGRYKEFGAISSKPKKGSPKSGQHVGGELGSVRNISFGNVETYDWDGDQSCKSLLSFRPQTAHLGYRTQLAYSQGFGYERMGQIFKTIGVAEECANEFRTGYGFSRKISSGNFVSSATESAPPSGTSSEQLAAAAAAREKVDNAVEKDPSMDESAKSRLYASEFFSKNPCIAYLPWQVDKPKKEKRKKVAQIKPPKCKCTAHVNTIPMTNTKFTEIDFLTFDQCTWTDNPTTDKCEGTEVTTCDQFTSATPIEIIDSSPPRESLVSLVSIPRKSESIVRSETLTPRESITKSESIAKSESTAKCESIAPHEPSIVEYDSRHTLRGALHSLVSHVPTEHPLSAVGGSISESFAKLKLGGDEAMPDGWDGVVYCGKDLVCCPPCVDDPCVLGRLWRQTPTFSDVVRAPPLCDCCAAIVKQGRASSLHS